MICGVENEKLCREKLNKLSSLLTKIEDLRTKIKEVESDKNFSDDPDKESRAWAILNKEEMEIILQRRIKFFKEELETTSFDFMKALGKSVRTRTEDGWTTGNGGNYESNE